MKLRKFQVNADGDTCCGIFDNNFEFKAHSIREAIEYVEKRQQRHDRKGFRLVEKFLLSEQDYNNAPCYLNHLYEVIGDDLVEIEI